MLRGVSASNTPLTHAAHTSTAGLLRYARLLILQVGCVWVCVFWWRCLCEKSSSSSSRAEIFRHIGGVLVSVLSREQLAIAAQYATRLLTLLPYSIRQHYPSHPFLASHLHSTHRMNASIAAATGRLMLVGSSSRFTTVTTNRKAMGSTHRIKAPAGPLRLCWLGGVQGTACERCQQCAVCCSCTTQGNNRRAAGSLSRMFLTHIWTGNRTEQIVRLHRSLPVCTESPPLHKNA